MFCLNSSSNFYNSEAVNSQKPAANNKIDLICEKGFKLKNLLRKEEKNATC